MERNYTILLEWNLKLWNFLVEHMETSQMKRERVVLNLWFPWFGRTSLWIIVLLQLSRPVGFCLILFHCWNFTFLFNTINIGMGLEYNSSLRFHSMNQLSSWNPSAVVCSSSLESVITPSYLFHRGFANGCRVETPCNSLTKPKKLSFPSVCLIQSCRMVWTGIDDPTPSSYNTFVFPLVISWKYCERKVQVKKKNLQKLVLRWR